jgi:uncharacterized heparinase superfamily protein
MIEEARKTSAVEGASAVEFTSNGAMESAALAGAAAIQQLVVECNGLRNRLSMQETELIRLRGANDGLRRRFGLLHQRYVELAKNILSQLEQFDGAIREAGRAVNAENGNDTSMVLPPRPQGGNGSETDPSNSRDAASTVSQAAV